jgi:hypothetical protein
VYLAHKLSAEGIMRQEKTGLPKVIRQAGEMFNLLSCGFSRVRTGHYGIVVAT